MRLYVYSILVVDYNNDLNKGSVSRYSGWIHYNGRMDTVWAVCKFGGGGPELPRRPGGAIPILV